MRSGFFLIPKYIDPYENDKVNKPMHFFRESMCNVYETFGEEETAVLTDLLREYLGMSGVV